MSFNEVVTLFHEFGHALQGMLTTVDHAGAAGLSNIEWDAVEICSQFMENWCYHQPTLVGMTAHVETGEPLPDALFDKITQARTYRAGSDFMRQLCFAVTDMTLHTTFDPDGGQAFLDVYREVAKTYAPLPPLDEDRFLCAFGHIFAGGYAAGYYSYKWSEVLSADCFGAFEEAGLDDDSEGRRGRPTLPRHVPRAWRRGAPDGRVQGLPRPRPVERSAVAAQWAGVSVKAARTRSTGR